MLRSHPRFALTLLGCLFFFLTHTISNTYVNALVGKAGGTASAVGTSLAISAVLELPAMTLSLPAAKALARPASSCASRREPRS